MTSEVVIGSGNRRPVQKRRVRRDGWTEQRRQGFLDTLAGTCNVRIACDAVGMPTVAAYRLRRADGAFAELWREALALGYERLETALLERALQNVGAIHPGEGDEATVIAADKAVAEMDLRLIAMVLTKHRAARAGRPSSRAAGKPVATEAETNAALLKKLAVLERQVRDRA